MEENEKLVEMMEEIKKQNSKTLFYQRVEAILLLIFIIAVAIITPSLIKTLDIAQETLGNTNEVVLHADDAISQLEDTVTSVQELVSDSGEGMEDALDKMNSIDIDTLNNAIGDLSEVVKPLADFFGKFKK